MKNLILTLAAVMTFGLTACAQKGGGQTVKSTNSPLIVYFSATGNTAKVARTLADVTGGMLCEIVPQQTYTSADLNWHDSQSRSSVEINDPKARPELKEIKADVGAYDIVFIGYPIWWDQAPRIINTFIERYDLKGKKLIPFATSGGSGINNSVNELKKAYPDLNWGKGKLLNRAGRNAIQSWAGEAMENR